ncbi:MAG: hypothetical protein V1904_13365 [Bacteroidota bacterium]
MNFFNKLFRKITGDTSNSRFSNWYLKSDDDKWQESDKFLKEIGATFPGSKVILRKNDDLAELQGNSDGFPWRVKLGATTDGEVDLEMKMINPLGFIDLEYDPEIKAENEVKTNDEWNEEDASEKRIFFGKGVFIEGEDSSNEARQFQSLPDEFRQELVNHMIHVRHMYFRIRPDILAADFHETAFEMADPVGAITASIQLMIKSAHAVGSKKPVKKGEGGNLVTCRYCKSLQYFSSDGCCNCGAPFESEK